MAYDPTGGVKGLVGYVPKELLHPSVVLVDHPFPKNPAVRRLTLNVPQKRNALSYRLRGQLLHELQKADQDLTVRVVVIRANGKDFCGGYEVDPSEPLPSPVPVSPGEGAFVRANVDLWTQLWDMRIVLICQIHGHCLAGGTELAA